MKIKGMPNGLSPAEMIKNPNSIQMAIKIRKLKEGENQVVTMLMSHHDSMPSFMNFRRVLDLQEF